MSNFKVAIGPMSREIVEATFQYSHTRGVPLALIATKNQIDYKRGYVENWSTAKFMDTVQALRGIYPHADVAICRDHCGPGFNGNYDMQDVYETIAEDCRCGFDLIHIDYCKMQVSRERQVQEACLAIAIAKQHSPNMRFEIGTDEISAGPPDMDQIKRELDAFMRVCTPEFYVVNTGSLTLENRQVGTFNHFLATMAHDLLSSHGVKLKEHNADWLTPEQIQARRNCVDAVNIAPELGVQQTRISAPHKMFATDFRKLAFEGEKWRKWLLPTTELGPDTWDLCIDAAGHYHFASQEYQFLRNLVGRENLLATASEVIDRYVQNLK